MGVAGPVIFFLVIASVESAILQLVTALDEVGAVVASAWTEKAC